MDIMILVIIKQKILGRILGRFSVQFTQGDYGVPTVILETIVSHDLWFWHAFFGMAGSNNDLNVLHASPIFNDILQGKAPDMSYVVNGNEYKYGYYLGDGYIQSMLHFSIHIDF